MKTPTKTNPQQNLDFTRRRRLWTDDEGKKGLFYDECTIHIKKPHQYMWMEVAMERSEIDRASSGIHHLTCEAL